MKKIKVSLEGRDEIYLIDKNEAKKMINDIKWKNIHHQFQSNGMFIGTDWTKTEVLELIDNARGMALDLEPNFTLGHHFVVLADNGRNAFDVGNITKKDIEIIK